MDDVTINVSSFIKLNIHPHSELYSSTKDNNEFLVELSMSKSSVDVDNNVIQYYKTTPAICVCVEGIALK